MKGKNSSAIKPKPIPTEKTWVNKINKENQSGWEWKKTVALLEKDV